MEISSPRLNAWLNRRRDWKVETNGNQDKIAIGVKMIIPIAASYIRANSRTESHNPNHHTILFHAIASCLIDIKDITILEPVIEVQEIGSGEELSRNFLTKNKGIVLDCGC